MKKIHSALALLSLTLLFSSNALAGDPFKGGMTLKLTYALPQGSYGENMPYSFGNYAYDLKTMNPAIGLQFGTMYFLNFIDIGDKMAIGIDVTWFGASYQNASYSFLRNYTDNNVAYSDAGEFNMYYLMFNAGVGPSFSFSPAEKLALDLSFKVSPAFAVSAGKYSLSAAGGDSENLGASGFGFLYTPSFYFRYRLLLLGVEYNIGDIDMNYVTSGRVSLKTSKIPMNYNALKIVLGLKF